MFNNKEEMIIYQIYLMMDLQFLNNNNKIIINNNNKIITLIPLTVIIIMVNKEIIFKFLQK